ncbi:MAG TPA: DUF5996 family protein [Anaeromyxobacter sp.]|nr:DUF5996 family protein [Anaeromyxobacter sp.]
MDDDAAGDRWPELPLAPWRGTRDTLHMWTQVVGKTLLALAPPQNHFWHCALSVTSCGLASPAPMLDRDRCLDVELDLVDHVLRARCDGRSRAMPLEPRTVRAFYLEYMALLRELGIDVHVWTTPVEVPDPIPFERDEVHHEYDRAAATRFFQVLRSSDAALRTLSNGFVGKQSPVHFFWGSFDLAATRFSGRRAPERPGVDAITREAYSHEVISFGFWPGGTTPAGVSVDEPVFYAYAAPEPAGFRDAAVAPATARYDPALGEFVLPYEAVRSAADPAGEVRAFCESVYEAGSTLGAWDRAALDRAPAPPPAGGAAEHGGLHPVA